MDNNSNDLIYYRNCLKLPYCCFHPYLKYLYYCYLNYPYCLYYYSYYYH